MSPPPALLEALRSVAGLLSHEGLRWYVFGAQAVVVYGRPRLTADLDVTVEATLERALALLRSLRGSGFESRAPDPESLLRRARILALVHTATGFAVDMMIAGPGLEEEFLTNRRMIAMGGDLEVPVISPEDLVVTEILAGRPKDLEDVDGILREQGGGLDLERSRHFLRALEGALGRGDLVSTLDRLVG